MTTRDDFYALAASAIASGAVPASQVHQFTKMANGGWERAYAALALAAQQQGETTMTQAPPPPPEPARQPANGNSKPRFRVSEYMTKTRWLHVEDALEIGKLRLFAGEYQRGNGASATAYHFLDLDDARVIFFDLSLGRVPENGQAGKGYTEYKGSVNGEITSRVLRINKGSDGKIWFELKSGPGKRTSTGAIQPAGEPTAAVSVALAPYDARRLGAAVLAYLDARNLKYWRDQYAAQMTNGNGAN